MQLATLRHPKLTDNIIFDINHISNRDNCYEPWVRLREEFAKHNIELNTWDVNLNKKILFELHMDVQEIPDRNVPTYLLMLETPFIKPRNADEKIWSAYKEVFTWNDQLVDQHHFKKLNFPNPIKNSSINGWNQRDIFCSLIAGNKKGHKYDERDLYGERVKAIKWFEKNAPENFELYGKGWNKPWFGYGVIGKCKRHIWTAMRKWREPVAPFPSYKGAVTHKSEVLLRSRFSICYENIRDLPGYITEKIFDAFFSGCVPVYWGAANVDCYIPNDCFIDRRKFQDTAAVYNYLKAISEKEFFGYQQRIAVFLESEAAQLFGSAVFADTVVSSVMKDYG
jgi:hypothetical protein